MTLDEWKARFILRRAASALAATVLASGLRRAEREARGCYPTRDSKIIMDEYRAICRRLRKVPRIRFPKSVREESLLRRIHSERQEPTDGHPSKAD